MKIATATPAVAIRSIAPRDRDELVRFYAGLSRATLEARFHGACTGIAAAAAEAFARPGCGRHQGFVAEVTSPDGRPTIVGHVCIEPAAPGIAAEAELAIAVADAWHGRGVGRALLREALAWATSHGIRSLVASIRWGNAAMLGLLRSTG